MAEYKKLLSFLCACAFLAPQMSHISLADGEDIIETDGVKTVFAASFGRVSYNGKVYKSYKTIHDAMNALGAGGGKIAFQGTMNLSQEDFVKTGAISVEGIGAKASGNVLVLSGDTLTLDDDLSLSNLVINMPENGRIITDGHDFETNNAGSYFKETYVSGSGENIITYPSPISVVAVSDEDGAEMKIDGGYYKNIVIGSEQVKTSGDFSLSLSDITAESLYIGSQFGKYEHSGNIVAEISSTKLSDGIIKGEGTVDGNVVIAIGAENDISAFEEQGKLEVSGKKVLLTAEENNIKDGFFDIEIICENGSIAPEFSGNTLLGFSLTDKNGFPAEKAFLNGIDITSENGIFSISDGKHKITPLERIKIALNRNSNYVAGYSDGTFLPQNNITRAEAVTMMSRLIADEASFKELTESEYADVSKDSWYSPYIGLFETLGYLDTLSEKGNILPDSKITRGEFCEVLSKIYPLASAKHLYKFEFSDVSEEYKYHDAVGRSSFLGIVNGYEDGTFRPDNLITRAEAVTMINRLLGRIPENSEITVFSDTDGHWAKGQINASACEKEKDGITMWKLESTNKFDKYIKYRGSLSNTKYKLENEKKLNVAFIGGSVTAGSSASDTSKYSWRARTVQWFRESYPDCEIGEVNAAIGDSYTKYAVYRLDNDLLKYDFDLLFVEYAINDSPWYSAKQDSETVIYFETLLRRVYEHNPNAEIVIVYTIDNKVDRTLEYFPTAAAQEKYGEYYDIPSVNFGKALSDYLIENDYKWENYFSDYVHPLDNGHEYYAAVLSEYLAAALSSAESTEVYEKALPEKINQNLWYDLTMLEASEIDLSMSKNWALTDDGRYIYATDKDNELVIKTVGTDICIASTRANEMNYSVDGGELIYMKMNRKPQTLAENLSDGEHILRIYALNPSASKIERVMYNG